MATTNGNRKLLDLRRWEPIPSGGFFNFTVGNPICHIRHTKPLAFTYVGSSNFNIYDPIEDGTVNLRSSGVNGTSSGSAMVAIPWSTGSTTGVASLTALSGTTSTIATNQTLVQSLAGYKIHILSGPNAGSTLTITSNTIGANSVITVPTQASAFSASTVFRLCTPRVYTFSLGTLSGNFFLVYDHATATVTSLPVTGLPSTFTTYAQLVATPSWLDDDYLKFATGTATSATGTTLVNSAKAWTTNQWTNYQVRIVSGTGAGQIRTISSNTGDTLTVPTWTTTPDNTSVYSIEGNDDFLYLTGNSAVTLYRYQISTNTWTTLSPTTARSTQQAQSGFTWISQVSDSSWTNENAIQNGRYIYGWRSSSGMDVYDIALNTWSNSITTGGLQNITVVDFVHSGDRIYARDARNTGQQYWYSFDLATRRIIGITNATNYISSFTTWTSNTIFDFVYTDGATKITYLYAPSPASTGPMQRLMLF